MNYKNLYKKSTKYHFVLIVLLSLFMSIGVYAQNKTSVSGLVKDENGLPMIEVNVLEKGTTNGVSTDLDGKFTLQVAGPKSIIEFSFIGYQTMTQVVGIKNVLNVSLKNEASKLEDVVVIGYGTAKKSDLTGSVTSIGGDDLKKLSMANVAETLTGRVAGVQVTSAEGSPDAEIKIKIRGGGSLTQDSSPLYIVDGFPINNLSDISPSDIDKITILKDASSTAIYGSRGANGVIIITTKSGSKNSGKVSVSYNTFYGSKKMVKDIDVLNPLDYAKWQYEYALLADDIDSYESAFGTFDQIGQFANVEGTNWQDEIYGRNGEVQNHDIGIRGGVEKLSYNFNFARFNEEAIMIGSNFKRDNISLNLKSKASDKVDLSFTIRYSDTRIKGAGANEQREFSSVDSRLKHIVGYSPVDLPGITTDDTDEAVNGYLVNPYVAVADNDRLQFRKNYNFLGGISWKIINNLQFKSDFGLDNYNYTDHRFYGRSTYYVNNTPLVENQGAAALISSERKDTRFRNANTLNYDFKEFLGSDHKLSVLVGEELINYKSESVTNTLHGFPKLFSFSDALNLNAEGSPFSVNNFTLPDDKLLSFFGRVNYDYKSKYLVTASFRADGSSKFLSNNRWGYFPSAAVAWKINKESFLKDVSWVNELKLRYSYGLAGNNNIPTGQTIQLFVPGNSGWINGVSDFWAPTNVLANPDLKWETTLTQNLGLDYEFFKGRISGSVEVYRNITDDLLLRYNIPGSGYAYQFRNMGEIENKGLEAALNLIAIDKKDYGLNFSVNIGMNKNKIKSLGLQPNFGWPTNWASTAIGDDYVINVGGSIGEMYGYVSDGRYEVSDFNYAGGVYTLADGVSNNSGVTGAVSPGMMKLKDLNGDGIVDLKDRKVIGNANPTSTGGFVINANAHGFDLSAAFNWSYGNDVYNANKVEFNTSTPNGQFRNLTTEMADGVRWTNVDASGQLVTDPAALTALNANTTLWSPNMQRFVFSDWAVEDGSFLRLNTLTLGYTFPQSLVSTIGISKLRLYTTASNVFILTKYSGPDPEVSTRRDTPLTPGVDFSAYPRSRQIVFGLNLNF